MTSYSGDRVKSSIKRWLIRWAEDHGDQVIALVAFGSDGLGDQSASSDLDLCYILCDENLCQSFAETLLSTIRREFSSGLVSVVEDRKLLMLLPEGNFVTKVDCYVAHDLSSIERLIVGSELPSNRLENGILLYENQMYSARVKAYLQVILTKEPPTNDIAAAIIKQRLSFINAFETASHKRSISDKYQFYFQLFLCHIYLVKLEYIRQGGRHFVYMPKMAYNSFPNEVRRHFEDELETRGRLDLSSEVLSKYLAQFLNTLTALLEQFPGAVDDHLSTQRIENVLSTVLERDRFYNFRDAGQGAIPHSLLFRSAFYKIGEIVQKYQVRTVLDLRTDKERSQNPLVLPQQVTHLEIDIFSCSTAEMLGKYDIAKLGVKCN